MDFSLGNTLKDLNVEGSGNKFTGGNDNSVTHITTISSTTGKLASLFERLKTKFEKDDSIAQISEDLKRYLDDRDRIGLEEKLKQANMSHLFDEWAWCKQEFTKKLVKYQNYEPAQEIFAYILAIVLEKYRNVIRPQIVAGADQAVVLGLVSSVIVQPILTLIQEEGCNDIMGLSSTEIDGMFHFLTGNCHIKLTT